MIECTILDNGDLEVTMADPEARADLADWPNRGQGYWGTLADLFEGYSSNGSYTPFEPDTGERYCAPFVGLTNAPCVAEDYTINDDGTHEIIGRLWWFPDYAVKDPLDELAATGRTVFTLAQ